MLKQKTATLIYFSITLAIVEPSYKTHKNTSDVYIISSGHSEVGAKKITHKIMPQNTTTSSSDTTTTTTVTTEQFAAIDEDKGDEIVFVPNANTQAERYKAERRKYTYNDNREPTIEDVLANRKSLKEVYDKSVTTDPPADIMFVSGKNRDNSYMKPEKPAKTFKVLHADEPRSRKEIELMKTTKPPPVDCKQLDCDNTIKSVCGGKTERNVWKYRLFMNQCYFDKVNCGFRYEQNKYQVVDKEYCATVSSGHGGRPYVRRAPPLALKPIVTENQNISGRRSLHIGLDGERCTHPCPKQCTSDYNPECAMSSSGERRVFVNHCKLDDNSCIYGITWRKRPMSECVGGKKADMYQNRAFISWMQKVGIVDNKGRLVLT